MIQCGAFCGPIERTSAPKAAGPITPVHDLNVPYEGPEEYETPTAEMLFPPVISTLAFHGRCVLAVAKEKKYIYVYIKVVLIFNVLRLRM